LLAAGAGASPPTRQSTRVRGNTNRKQFPINGCLQGEFRVKKLAGKEKGCDIGYAPVASSCEGANVVDTCTVTALDVITAFAVPNPNCSSQKQSVFSGLVTLRVAPPSRSLSLLRTGSFYLANPFSRRREQH